MTYTQIVKKLVGEIKPVGASHVDDKRLDNLVEMIGLVDNLLGEIIEVAEMADHHEHSIKLASQKAQGFLSQLKEMLNEQA